MLTLWDFLKPIRDAIVPRREEERRGRERARVARTARRSPAKEAMQERYDEMVREMLGRYSIKVRKWRKNSSGIARLTMFKDGSAVRTLESPRPTGPVSAAIFLHEVGHHAIGFGVHKLRCLEEYHAWAFAMVEMNRRGLVVNDAVRVRMHESLHYAIAKARRRGLHEVPQALLAFCAEPPKRTRHAARRGD